MINEKNRAVRQSPHKKSRFLTNGRFDFNKVTNDSSSHFNESRKGGIL
jgi:hypothetical protein